MSYNLGTASGRIVIDGSGAEKGFAVAETAALAFFAVIQDKLDAVERLGENLMKIGASGSAGLGLAVKSAASFEERLSAVEAVSGATEEQMKAVSAAALRIGKDTKYSATEAASAIEELVKAGISVEDALDGAADATVALASAGEVALPRAAEIASNAMNNFDLDAKAMPRVADLIAGAANASAISVDEFASSLAQGGAVAAITGLKFDDLAVAIAEMGNAGIKGSDAGTSIKTFLTNLIPTTDSQIKKFEDLGLVSVRSGKNMAKLAKMGIRPVSKRYDDVHKALQKYIVDSGQANKGTAKAYKLASQMGAQLGVLGNEFFDATGKVKPMAEIQETLAKATKGMTEETKLATLELLFGSDAIRAAAVLSKEGAKGYNDMAAAMGKVTAADVAATRMDNLKGSIEQLKGSFETMLITIGTYFIPLVRRVVDGISSMVDKFNELDPRAQKFIAIFLGVGSAVAFLTGLFIKLLFILVPLLAKFLGFRALKSVFSIFTVGFKAMRSGAGAMVALNLMAGRAATVFTRLGKIGKFLFGVLKRFPAVLGALRTAIAFAFGPWGIAIAAIVTALVLLYKKWAPFRDLVNRVAAAVKGGLLAAWQKIQEVWKAVLPYLQEIGRLFMQNVIPALKAAGGSIMQALMKAWQSISDTVMNSFMPAMREAWATIQNDVVPALKQLWVTIGPVIKTIAKVVAIIIGGLLYALFQVVKFIVAKVLPVLIKWGAILLGGIIKVLTKVITIIIQVIGVLVKWGAVILGVVVKVLAFLANFIKTVFVGIWNIIKMALDNIKKNWEIVWGLFGPLIKAALNLVIAVITFFVNTARNIFSTGWNWISSKTSAVFGWIGNKISSVMNWINSKIAAVVGAIRGFISKHFGGAATEGTAAFERLRSAISEKVDAFNAKVKGIVDKIKGYFSGAKDWLFQAGRNIIQGLIDGISGMVKALTDKLNFITNLIPEEKGPERVDKRLLRPNGQMIMKSLIGGFQDNERELKQYLRTLTTAIPSEINTGYNVALAGSLSPVKNIPAKPKDAGNAAMRLLSGTLGIDASGRAYIRGVAQEVVDSNESFDGTIGRMGTF